MTASLYSRTRIRMQKIVETYDIEHKMSGARQGPLGLSARRVFNIMTTIVDRSGQLDASIAEIVPKMGLCRQTVRQSLTRLCDHGFLGRHPSIMRSRGVGPVPIYISDVYWITCPPALRSRRQAKRHARFYNRSQALARVLATLTTTPTIIQELGP